MNHTDLLNHLAKKHNLNSYLEIGVQNPANNFNKVICEHKVGVDPNIKGPGIFTMASDDYFDNVEQPRFDIIFIDGLHHADQVKRDFENSLACLNDNGFIVIHDCLPTEEVTTCVPRWNQKIWHGDVFKFVMTLKTYIGIDFITYNFDNGCCVVWKDESKTGSMLEHEVNWNNYKTFGESMMNIKEWK